MTRTTATHRLAEGGRIDRSRTLAFTVDGETYTGHPGDTVASALLAHGRIRVGDSIYRGRPRGIVAAGIEEPNAMLQVGGRPEEDVSEPMVPATVRTLTDGLSMRLLSGLGVLDQAPDTALYDKCFRHADVVVVGAGPAGLTAALEAGRTGARVVLIDDQPELGGSLLSERAVPAWVSDAAAELDALPEVTVLTRTSAFGAYDDNYLLAVESRTDHLEGPVPAGMSRQRLWHLRATEVVLATGAHERPLVFAGNDRPGVMLASAVRTYLNRYAVRPGDRVVVATTNDSTAPLVADLEAAGVEVAAVLDARSGPFLSHTLGEGRVTGVVTDTGETIPCDLLAVSGGWSPVVHLHSQRQGRLRWDDTRAAFVPDGEVRGMRVVGAAAGELEWLGEPRQVWLVPRRSSPDTEWPVSRPTQSDYDEHFVDLQRDQTVADVWRATGAGMTSVEHVKRYTSIGTANDQGKTSGVNAIGVIAAALGGAGDTGGTPGIGELGTTTYRAPYAPVSFAALAGRERGDLFDPERTTPIHPWHVEHGAEMEVVGQWLRPWYYPRPGETMDQAVARECRAARTGVAMQDASTLGKIELRGPDTGEFLNRIYTNGFKKLKVGSARYGVMCLPDGMIFDDGVTLRLGAAETGGDRYLMTTTTGNAAAVLDHLEEWLQTEWPGLDVSCTSVTEQWSTVAVVGPRSREVVARVAPDLDVSAEAFPFMTFRETRLASGVPARICRISFSGELAFEVNVAGWYGLAVWEEIFAAGEDLGITPYGTETMHVLRAEKGFPIVGQDTDGTVTPQDAGMEWIVSTTKDFLGKRSYARADTARTDRKHLVGVLPVDRETRLPEGTQLVTAGTPLDVVPVPMAGHVTSSYHSATLGRPFGLALVKDGRHRLGEVLVAPVADRLVEVELTSPVFYDPRGARRDG